jgi:NAD(P)-dependent dehydrogenase (short-subunit alcohol dehydrogenase family)
MTVCGVARRPPEQPTAGAGLEALQFVPADLSSMASVRQLAARIQALYPRLDLLVHNAAIVDLERVVTADGFERQFAVNHLAVYLLTQQLLPLLQRRAGARIVVTASQVEAGATLNIDDLMSSRDYQPERVYARTKLANVLFTYQLAKQLDPGVITVNCLHPGVIRTGLLDNLSRAQQLRARRTQSAAQRAVLRARTIAGSTLRALKLRPPVRDWALNTAAGAATTLFVATDPRVARVTGQYFSDCRVATSSAQSHEPALQRGLWNASAHLLQMSPEWPT